MNFDAFFATAALPSIFAAMGVDATVQRGAAAPVPVRIVVTRNEARLGEYGQVVARVDTVDMQLSQWQPQQGDVVAWSDHLGSHSKALTAEIEDDGFVAKAVLHG